MHPMRPSGLHFLRQMPWFACSQQRMKPTPSFAHGPAALLLALLLPLGPVRAADEAAIKAEIEAVRKAGLAQWKDRLPDNFETYVRDTGTRNYYQRQFNVALTNGNAAALAVVFKEFPEFARPQYLNNPVMQGKSALHHAVERGHREVVELLLAQKVGADAPRPTTTGSLGMGPFGPPGTRLPPGSQERRDTPLHVAVRAGNTELAALLLDAGANIEALDSQSATPLYTTLRLLGLFGSYGAALIGSEAYSRQEQMLELLLRKGAQVINPSRFMTERQALAGAIAYRKDEMLDRLLTNCVHLAVTNWQGDSLIHVAVNQGRTNALRALLEKSAPASLVNVSGFTPLHQSAWLPVVAGLPVPSFPGVTVHIESVTKAGLVRQRSADLLLAAGAEADAMVFAGLNRTNELAELLRRDPSQASKRDPQGRNPLHYAVNAGSTAALHLLLAAKADPEARDRSGQTPLIQALVQRRCVEATNLLAAAKVTGTNATGQTALHLAVTNGGDTNLVAALVAAGADMNARDAAGKTPLELAALNQRFDLVAWFELRGVVAAPPAARLMTTPLHQAVTQGNLLAVSNQLAFRADVNARNEQGHTPLALAVGAGRVDLVLFLLTNGANVNIPDTNGVTPLRGRFFAANDPVPDPLPKPGFSKRPLAPAVAKATTIRADSLPPELRPFALAGQPPLNNLLLLLLENGADPKLPDFKGNTILHALQPPPPDYGNPPRPKTSLIPEATARIRLLANYGLTPDTRATNGQTALHVMAAQANLIQAFALLEAGAGINKPDARGRTVLHHALTPQMNPYQWQNNADARRAITHLLALLLDNGADLRRADTNGATPLHLLTTMDGALRDLVLPVLRTNRHFSAALRARDKAGQMPVTQAFEQFRAKPVTPTAQLLTQLIDAGGQLIVDNKRDEATLLHDLAGIAVVGDPFFGPSRPDVAMTAALQRLASNVVSRAANVDARNAAGETPLHVATRHQNAAFAALLLARGASPNATDPAGDTPLHLAVRAITPLAFHQPHPMIPLLISNRCDLARRNQQGETPLRLAVMQLYLYPPLFLPPGATRSFTAAIREADFASLDVYLKLDSSLATITSPVSPLRTAAEAGHAAIAERLRDAGATDALAATLLGWTNSLAAFVRTTPDLGASRVMPGVPLLHTAAARGQLDAVKLLATPEVPADIADAWGRSAVYHATTNGDAGAAILSWLRARGVTTTVFDVLWLGDHARLAALLAERPALIRTTNILGLTPLLSAVDRGDPEAVRRLVAAGADPNEPAGEARLPFPGAVLSGTVPLHLAAWSNRVDLAEQLKGANVNATNRIGYTALHFAAARGHREIADWLLEHGSLANAQSIGSNTVMRPGVFPSQTSSGWTPLHVAVRFGQPRTIETLVKHGAKLDITDAQGRTPVDLLGVATSMTPMTQPWPPSPYPMFGPGMSFHEMRLNPTLAAEVAEVLRKVGAVVPTARGPMFINRGVTPGLPPPAPGVPATPKR